LSGAEKAGSSKLKSLTEKTLKRDDYTCRFCGFRAKQYQRVIPWVDAGDPPYATICTFCEPCLSLERNGVTGSGLLLWLPEISQVELNHLARAIYVARAEEGTMEGLATRALDSLMIRRTEAKKRLGSDDPLLLATILRESLSKKEVEAAITKLDGIRLLPSEKYMVRGAKGDANQLPRLAQYWLSKDGPYGQQLPSTWQDNLQKVLAKTGTA
jgi:intracellular multiplication protein IcmJ